MLKMRLQRIGRKNDALFRVVVTDSRRGPKSGKHVDIIDSYNPKMNRIEIDGNRAKEWIAKGVQVSDTVHNLLITNGTLEGKKKNVLPKKAPIIDPEKVKAEEEAKAAAEAATKAEAEAAVAAEAAAEEAPAEAEETPVEEATEEASEAETSEEATEAPAEEATEEKTAE